MCFGVVLCLGGLLCSWDAGSIKEAARFDRAISSLWVWVGFCLRCVVLRVPLLR